MYKSPYNVHFDDKNMEYGVNFSQTTSGMVEQTYHAQGRDVHNIQWYTTEAQKENKLCKCEAVPQKIN